jgi:hypothetical protein
MSIGQRIHQIRTQKGISQGDIQRSTGMRRGYVSGSSMAKRFRPSKPCSGSRPPSTCQCTGSFVQLRTRLRRRPPAAHFLAAPKNLPRAQAPKAPTPDFCSSSSPW